jgi:hypothetical protein
MRQRIRIVNLSVGDPADFEVYAGAAIWDWMQKDQFKQLQQYGIKAEDMIWMQGPINRNMFSQTVDIWAEVEPELAALLKLSGLCQLK